MIISVRDIRRRNKNSSLYKKICKIKLCKSLHKLPQSSTPPKPNILAPKIAYLVP